MADTVNVASKTAAPVTHATKWDPHSAAHARRRKVPRAMPAGWSRRAGWAAKASAAAAEKGGQSNAD